MSKYGFLRNRIIIALVLKKYLFTYYLLLIFVSSWKNYKAHLLPNRFLQCKDKSKPIRIFILIGTAEIAIS